MTFDETNTILTLLQTEYPQSFAKMDDRAMAMKLKLWASEFQYDDYKAVYAVVRAIISSGGREFAPNIGTIREKLRSFSADGELTENQAWSLVSRAISNGIYGYNDEFAKLPAAVQAAVGEPEQLKRWAVMPVDEVQSVVASNFQRSYHAVAQRERELAKIPPDVRELLTGVSAAMLPEAGA
jgi:hypothetical protein